MALGPEYSYPGVARGSSARSGGLLLALLLFVLVEVQVVFGEALSVGGVIPDVVLGAVVAAAIFRGREGGFWFGVVGGFLQDLASAGGTALGGRAIAAAVVGWLCGGFASSVRRTFVLVPVILVPLATVVSLLIQAALGGTLHLVSWSGMGLSAAANLLVGLPVYYIVALLPGGIQG